jgi:short-subunit dehydrogenase
MEPETALITGASAGIGKELAKLFAQDGANLVLVARRRDRLEELADNLRQTHGVTVHVLVEDLADPAAPVRVCNWVSDLGLTVDVLVNNAGFGALSPFTDLPEQKLLDMLQVNITSLTHLTRLFLPGMVESGRGGILNVARTASFQAGPNMATYYASKVYILHFTEALAEEVHGSGVKVSCLCPGPTHTEFQAVAGMEGSPIFRMGPMEAGPVARIGYRGFRRGQPLVIPGWRNWLGAFAVRFAPRRFVRRVVHGLNRVVPKEPITAPAAEPAGARGPESL